MADWISVKKKNKFDSVTNVGGWGLELGWEKICLFWNFFHMKKKYYSLTR